MRSVIIDPFYFFHGLFEDDALNDAKLLLPYENTRIHTLLMCLNRRWDVFSEEDAQTIVYCVAADIPFRGLDPCATLGLILMGLKNWPHPLIAGDVSLSGRSCLHRRELTCKWYPKRWDVVCDGVEAAQTVINLIEQAFQYADHEDNFNLDTADSDYEDCPSPITVKCGYNEEVVIKISTSCF